MNGKVKFLFFCTIFVGCGAFAQNNSTIIVINLARPAENYLVKQSLINWQVTKDVLRSGCNNPTKGPANYLGTLNSYVSNQQINNRPFVISPNYYTKNFGFFCKKELQLEKTTKIPFKFRLGSVQQCDWMEGKPNSGIR